MEQNQENSWVLLPPDEFAALGIEDLAYVKPKPAGGRELYAIHTADGSEVAVVEGRELAFATVAQNELKPLSVH
ncbi:MAG: DUF1150 domain-containing protein [Alphaproteobacteria bacterium]|nr:DUF1150 domain-containing protein [Alphaproteobacteria bacterium]